ncbi:MAG: flagellar hook protein FlgE [Candidatus Accumulibacter sp.]|jgi:flagellar hook protein FlgE|nr:flagellar hook protein FlgE [Accumulibacter sp.]
MAFQQGLSGLNASSKALDVVGNNVANSSTVGFKASNAHFADIYAATLNGTGATQIGIGVTLASVFQQFTQGNVTSTNNPLDIAINGDGFFNLTRTDGTIAYSRNGQFHPDNQGYIVNDQGCRLMGYPTTSTGIIVPSTAVPIQIDTSNVAPRPSGSAEAGNARMELNLDSRAEDPAITPFDPGNPLTYTYSTPETVYDTLGVEHTITYFFVRNKGAGPGQWDIHAMLDGDATTARPLTGGLNFNTNGQLTTTAPIPLPTDWTITTGADTPLGDGQPNWNIDFSKTTSFAGNSTVNFKYDGGYGQGALSSVSVDSDGRLLGNYSNGQSKVLAQIVLSTFANPNGLISTGNNLFNATLDSGQPLVGVPESGIRGSLRPMSVEESNVDLTNELVAMITLQRNYQANAQTIRTQDQIMQTIVNLR